MSFFWTGINQSIEKKDNIISFKSVLWRPTWGPKMEKLFSLCNLVCLIKKVTVIKLKKVLLISLINKIFFSKKQKITFY